MDKLCHENIRRVLWHRFIILEINWQEKYPQHTFSLKKKFTSHYALYITYKL